MFFGSIVAIVTPFDKGQIDITALQALVNWHIQEGTQGIVVSGSTGEGLLLSPFERDQALNTCIKTAAGKIPILAACGAASTKETIDSTLAAKEAGAAAALVVSPYYVKPSQEGLYQHFQSIHNAVDIPIILYNNPCRSVVDMSVDLVARLAKLPNIVGIKDASSNLTNPIQMRQAIHKKDFCLISGDDPTSAAYLAHGGDGCISITANVAPRLCQQLMLAWREKNITLFAKLRDLLLPLHQALVAEANPIPVKYALSLLGRCKNELRLPLLPATSATQQKIQAELEKIPQTLQEAA